MSKKNLLNKAFSSAGKKPAEIENIIVTNREKLNPEKRSKQATIYLKPSEYKDFLALIGRESFSDIVREFILYASNKNTDNQEQRNLILSLIENK